MKKVLIILGGIFVALIIIFFTPFTIAGIDYFRNAPTLRAESKAWVDTEVPKIVSNWDVEEARKVSSKKLLGDYSESEVKDTFVKLSELFGHLDSYGGSRGDVGIHVNNFTKTISAEYIADASFEKGHTNISIELVKEDGEWKILGFHVNLTPSTTAQSF